MFKSNSQDTNWIAKEQRQLFCDKVGAFIIKCGAEKDPVLDKIFPLAEQIVKKAFELFPDGFPEKEKSKEVEPDFPIS